jgi:predicted CopG family antitoxin
LGHSIAVTDDVYDYLKDMIETEHVQNTDMSEDLAHRPTFSEVISHLIEDREARE